MAATPRWQSGPKPDRLQVMSIDKLADAIRVAKSTLYKLARGGKVPGKKGGKYWLFQRETIDRWLPRGDGADAKHQVAKR